MFFSFSFTWPHTNVFDRVNVNRVGFGKQKKQIHMSPFPPHYFLLATHMTFIPTIFIYLFIFPTLFFIPLLVLNNFFDLCISFIPPLPHTFSFIFFVLFLFSLLLWLTLVVGSCWVFLFCFVWGIFIRVGGHIVKKKVG